ncbi:hypothetical protein D3C81_1503580 [compost metagenome]
MPWWLLFLFGGDDHHQLASFQLRMLFDGTVFGEVLFDPLQQFHPQLLVSHLTTTESKRYLGLVPLAKETYQVA